MRPIDIFRLAGRVAGLFIAILTFASSAEAATKLFYVSTQGNDHWSGKLAAPNATRTDGPFATLTRARDALRALHPNGALLKTPVIVYVRGGPYALSHPLTFSTQDSGTASAPITYTAYPAEQPVISGGTDITGWTRYEGTAVPQPVAGELWVAQVPGASFRELFVNGKRRTRARMPNPGSYYNMDGSPTAWPAIAQFLFHPGDILSAWASPGDVEVVTLQSWAESRAVIRAVDATSQTVTLDGTFGPYGLEANARYWIENSLDALDSPGEWYLDQQSGVLYYYPKPGENMSQASAVAPRLTRLVQFQGNASLNQFVTNIRLSGFTFSYADWSLPADGHSTQAAFDVAAAVVGFGARSCSLKKNLFSHLGGYAIEFSQGSQKNSVVGNDLTDLGAGGVKIGDPQVPISSSLVTSGNQVRDNTIYDIGNVYPSAVGIWVGQSSDNSIAHNEIYDTYYSAISVGWTWGSGASAAARNFIQYNHLHDIGRGVLSDMGCIYTLGSQPGTVESYNLCHEVSRSLYGGWGIYMDAGSSGILVENNLVYGTQDGAFISGWASNNATLRNNIFALNETGELWRAESTTDQSLSFTHNIVYWDRGELLAGWTWVAWLNDKYQFDPNLYSFDYNLYYCPGDCPTYGVPFSQFFAYYWMASGLDTHSLVADPLFADPLHGDFNLSAISPAAQIGFQQIDLSSVGPRPALQR